MGRPMIGYIITLGRSHITDREIPCLAGKNKQLFLEPTVHWCNKCTPTLISVSASELTEKIAVGLTIRIEHAD